MRRRIIWLTAIAGLLVVGLVGQAIAGKVTQAAAGSRFGCGDVPGDPTTLSGSVTEQNWNTLLVDSEGTLYTVKTGPYKTGRNLPDLTGQTVTVEGYTGAGGDCQGETSATNLVRAKAITAGEDAYDLTQVPAGAGCGQCAQQRQGFRNQSQSGQGPQGGNQGSGGCHRNGGNGRGGSGACGSCPNCPGPQ